MFSFQFNKKGEERNADIVLESNRNPLQEESRSNNADKVRLQFSILVYIFAIRFSEYSSVLNCGVFVGK